MRQLLVYDGDACVGWCQYGTPDDAPNIKNHFHTGPEELYAQHGLARDRKIAKWRWVCGPRSAPAHAEPPV